MAAVDAFNSENRVPCILTHFAASAGSLFFKAFPEANIIHHIRHPLDVVESNRHRGWGEGFGVYPTSFGFTVEDADGLETPWFAVDNAREYAKMAPADRMVWMKHRILRKNDAGLYKHECNVQHFI